MERAGRENGAAGRSVGHVCAPRQTAVHSGGLCLLCVLLAALVLTGCSLLPKNEADSDAEGLRVYYTSQDGTELVQRVLKPRSEDFEGIKSELLDAFQNPTDSSVKSALPEGVEISSAVTGISEIDVDFSPAYLGLNAVSEVMLRAALVRTLLNLNGVETVRFTVDGQSLVIGGQEIGPMTEDSFVIPESGTINSNRFVEFSLYFAAEDGTSLVRELRSRYISSNLNTERLVVEQMIRGPENQNLLPVTTTDVLVHRVAVEDGICTVDFSAEVNDAPPESPVEPETALYAFVDAILDSCADQGVTGVRFQVEGESQTRFRGQVNLDQTFTRRPEDETEGGT